MKTLLLVLLALTCVPAQAGYETGAADQVLVMPHSGGRAHYGQVDLSQSAAVKNQLPLANGGTGQSSALSAFQSLYKSIATTLGDLVYGGASGTPTRLPIGSTNQVLAVVGGVPAWQGLNATFTAPTRTTLLTTGTTTGYLFNISTSTTCAVGDTYTNNSNTYTVLGALAAQTGQVLFMSGASAPTSSGTLTRGTGSGTSSVTFTATTPLATYTRPTPAPLYIKVRMIGGGGGGAGAGAGPANGGNGTLSAFGANLLIANGGNGGIANSSGGTGGTASLGSAIGFALTGGTGTGDTLNESSMWLGGGPGAASPFGGGGGGGGGDTSSGGYAAPANSGAGGGGGGFSTATPNNPGWSGSGGGAGGFIDATITGLAASYPYIIGTGGSAGSGGGNGLAGGAGGSGIIAIEEYYQ